MDGQQPDINNLRPGNQPQPGQTIAPGGSAATTPPQSTAPGQQATPVDQPLPVSQPVDSAAAPNQPTQPSQSNQPTLTYTEAPAVTAAPPDPTTEAAPQPPQQQTAAAPAQTDPEPSFYNPGGANSDGVSSPLDALPPSPFDQFGNLTHPEPAADSTDSISWTASEFITHHKTGGWYALLMLAAAVAAVLCFVVTRDIVSTVVIILVGAVLATMASHKPRQLSYRLDASSITIGNKLLSLHDFRSFSVMQEGAISSIALTPLKRFGFLTTIYYDPNDEQNIIQILSRSLPHETRQPDAIDGLLRRMRF